MAVLTAVRLALMSPESPDFPESPETAVGSASAVEVAGPVLPVLVEDDCAHAVPELPERATGLSVSVAPPPAPPLAWTWAMESPPTMLPSVMWELGPLARMAPAVAPALTPAAAAAPLTSPPRPRERPV